MGFNGDLIKIPSGNLRVCYWTWPIEINDFPKDCDFPVRYVSLPEGNYKL